jgi:argininosuccinate synthase
VYARQTVYTIIELTSSVVIAEDATYPDFFPHFQADVGQKEDFEAARVKAIALGALDVSTLYNSSELF